MVVTQTPDADGKVIHVVQPYQALTTIADAYHVSVDRILVLNGLQVDWPLQIGQKLVISPGNVTPSATLSNIQKLTPEADGKYYHIVQSGETLSWIAAVYDVALIDLMSWNGLNNTSVIRPGERLLLAITPPATATLTPGPATNTALPSPTMTPASTATPAIVASTAPRKSSLVLIVGVTIIVVGGLLGWMFLRGR
jgi:LysM repeat protein